MTGREILVLVAILAIAQLFLAALARLLGLRLPLRVAALGAAVPLAFLAPWLLTSKLLVPSDGLSTAIPGAVPSAAPDPHALLNDVVYQLLPWELEVRHALAAGRLPLWSDGLEGGSSPWLNPQSGALSPIALLSRPLPIQHHLLAGLALEMMIALEGTWLLVRALGARPLAASLGGAGFALSGGIQAWALLPPSAAASWVPWVALAALRVVRGPRGRRIAGAAIVVACLLLSGNPEVAAFAMACAAVWAAALATRRGMPRARGSGARGRGRGLAAGLLAAVLGAALAAPVLVPFALRVPDAQRLDEAAFTRVPVETLDLAPSTWFLPTDVALLRAPLGAQVFGRPYRGLFQGTLNWAEASAGYAGLLALAGSALALASPRRRRALPFVLTALFLLVLAAGFLPLRAAVAAVPGLGLAATGRVLPVMTFGLAVAGALGLDQLLRRRLSRWVAVFAILPMAMLSLAADARLASAVLWAAIATAALLAAREPRVASALLAAALVADLATWAVLLLPRGDTAAFYPVTGAIETLRVENAAPGGPWRSTGEDLAVYPSLLSVYGLDELRPHNPLAPRDQVRVLHAAFGFSPARRYFGPLGDLEHPLLDFLNVRSVVSYSTRPGAPGFRPLPRTLERIDAGELGTFRLLRHREALPRAFAPTAVDVVRDDQIEVWIERMRDPRRVAVRAGEVEPRARAMRRWDPRAVEVVSWEPGAIRLRVSLPDGGLVATSVPGPGGWRARAGGIALERVTVNGAFLGVVVPPGVREIALGYRPPGFIAGVVLGALALAAVGASLVVDRRRAAGSRRARAAHLPWPPRSTHRSLRTTLPWAVGAALVLYLGASLARETISVLRPYWLYGPHAFRELAPHTWRLESAPAERMATFLAAVAPRIPEGSRVAFAGLDLPGTQSAYRAMWAAYLLPRHQVVPAGQAWDAEYHVAYRTRLDRDELELVWENEEGALYRARRESAAPSRDGQRSADQRPPALSSPE